MKNNWRFILLSLFALLFLCYCSNNTHPLKEELYGTWVNDVISVDGSGVNQMRWTISSSEIIAESIVKIASVPEPYSSENIWKILRWSPLNNPDKNTKDDFPTGFRLKAKQQGNRTNINTVEFFLSRDRLQFIIPSFNIEGQVFVFEKKIFIKE